MKSCMRIGIIDIGSNSVRRVVYERLTRGAYRVIDGGDFPFVKGNGCG